MRAQRSCRHLIRDTAAAAGLFRHNGSNAPQSFNLGLSETKNFLHLAHGVSVTLEELENLQFSILGQESSASGQHVSRQPRKLDS